MCKHLRRALGYLLISDVHINKHALHEDLHYKVESLYIQQIVAISVMVLVKKVMALLSRV